MAYLFLLCQAIRGAFGKFLASYLYNTLMKCYQIIQFLETRIQRLFDGLIFIEKRTRRARTAHAQNE